MNLSRILFIVGLMLPFSARIGASIAEDGSAVHYHHHPVEIGLVCRSATSAMRRQIHEWDDRFTGGRSGKVCVDSGNLLSFAPLRVGTRYDTITEHRVLILQLGEKDAQQLKKLTTLDSSELAQQVFMLDGRVVMMAPIGGPFSGAFLTLDPSSDEEALALAALISL